jgi:hypothetical protein
MDKDNSGTIELEEFIYTMAIFLKGSEKERLECKYFIKKKLLLSQ